jgi:hypothetical protein
MQLCICLSAQSGSGPGERSGGVCECGCLCVPAGALLVFNLVCLSSLLLLVLIDGSYKPMKARVHPKSL